jgi:hypothetical protein
MSDHRSTAYFTKLTDDALDKMRNALLADVEGACVTAAFEGVTSAVVFVRPDERIKAEQWLMNAFPGCCISQLTPWHWCIDWTHGSQPDRAEKAVEKEVTPGAPSSSCCASTLMKMPDVVPYIPSTIPPPPPMPSAERAKHIAKGAPRRHFTGTYTRSEIDTWASCCYGCGTRELKWDWGCMLPCDVCLFNIRICAPCYCWYMKFRRPPLWGRCMWCSL